LLKALAGILGIIAALSSSLWLPAISFAGTAVKFEHIVSIYSDAEGMGLKEPEGVACNEKSPLYVADTGNGRILRFIFKNNALETGAAEIKPPQISYPLKMKIDSREQIYVLDGKERRIVRLTSEGRFKDYLEPSGLPSPASYVIGSFDLDADDDIYILDILSRRVLELGPDGRYRRHIPFPGDFGGGLDIAVDFRKNILLVDGPGAKVFSASRASSSFSLLSGGLREYMRFPTSVATDSRGRIYLVDRNGGSIIILGQDGSFIGRRSGKGWKEGLLNYPSQMCINGKGQVFIADTNNSRIQIFTILE